MRITRGAAAKEAAVIGEVGKETIPDKVKSTKENIQSIKTNARPKKTLGGKTTAESQAIPTKTTAKSKSMAVAKANLAKTPVSKKTSEKAKDDDEDMEGAKSAGKGARSASTKQQDEPSKPAPTSKKRKRPAAPKVEDDPDELPHGLGKLWKPSGGDGVQTVETEIPGHGTDEQIDAKVAVKPEESSATVSTPAVIAADLPTSPAGKKKRARGKATAKPEGIDTAVIDPVETPAIAASDIQNGSPSKKSPKKKGNAYGLTPGVTPYPDWPHPTPEECHEVNKILSELHGNIKPPEKIPPPSETVAGCGEVPSVLDAVIRTYLSSNTTSNNSSTAFQGLIDTYGKQATGIGKGSVNWDAVRRSPVDRLIKAIYHGGMAPKKSQAIQKILNMVYSENQARRSALREADEQDNDALLPAGAENEGEAGQAAEIARTESDILSLDHLHAMSDNDVLFHLIYYPGVGVKTASCVSLFCLRRPSFAVDTHVFRLCQWLGWVPKTANRDKTFMHCEVRIPNELKYSLHQLFIMHGKKCPRCRAITGESSEGWKEGCVIDHLVTRTGLRKGGASPEKGKGAKGQGKKRKKGESDEEIGSEDGNGEDGSDFEASPKKAKARRTTKTTPKKTPIKGNAAVKKGAVSSTPASAKPSTSTSKAKGGQHRSAVKKDAGPS